MEEILKEFYYDPATGYTSAKELYKKVKESGHKVTHKMVSEFVKKQETAQINRPDRKPTVFNSIISPAPRNNYQIDIMVYDRYSFNNYKYILMCMDVYSRYLDARAMTNREMNTILTNLKSIFVKMGKPAHLNADNEFNKTQFNQLMKDLNVTVHYSAPYEVNKNAIVERANRTIAQRLQKWRTATGKYDWPSVLPDTVANFNNSVNRTIHGKPSDIFNGKKMNLQTIIKLKPSFKINDSVRLKIYKGIFAKGDAISYTKEVYKIVERIKNKYKLKNTETNEISPTLYKDYEIRKANDIQYIPKPDQSQLIQHEIIQTDRRVKRAIRKEGIEDSQVVKAPRKRTKPIQQLFNLFASNPKPKAKPKAIPQEYEVEKLLEKKIIKRKVHYLVKWKGYSKEQSTYEPAETLIKQVPELVKSFNQK
jgi:hypothetical protein